MSSVQKIIKYLALAFAFFLIFTIISWIMYGISIFANLFNEDNAKEENLSTINVNEQVKSLDIDVMTVNIKFKEGDILKLATNNNYIKVRQDSNKLSIIEKKKGTLFKTDRTDLIIYVPSSYSFNDVAIDSGTGMVGIDRLTTNNLYLDLGAGKISINNLFVRDSTEIDGGAGEINVNGGILNDLDLDMGVGKFTLSSRIMGNSKIDAGVGEMNLNLMDSSDEYEIKLDKGIGSARLNGKDMKNGSYGYGSNFIDIDGGVGSINIKTK